MEGEKCRAKATELVEASQEGEPTCKSVRASRTLPVNVAGFGVGFSPGDFSEGNGERRSSIVFSMSIAEKAPPPRGKGVSKKNFDQGKKVAETVEGNIGLFRKAPLHHAKKNQTSLKR